MSECQAISVFEVSDSQWFPEKFSVQIQQNLTASLRRTQ